MASCIATEIMSEWCLLMNVYIRYPTVTTISRGCSVVFIVCNLLVIRIIVFSSKVTNKMSDHSQEGDRAPKPIHIDPILPNFGVTIASDKMSLQLCRPKLLPLKTYSYMRAQLQVRNRLEQSNIVSNDKI